MKNFNHKLFKESRTQFDKPLRRAERSHKKQLINEIEDHSTKNPREFWNLLKSLGPKKKCDIPLQVQVDEKNVYDQDIILKTWQKDFSGLYNKSENSDSDQEFYKQVMNQKKVLENSQYFKVETQEDPLNKQFTSEELENVIKI